MLYCVPFLFSDIVCVAVCIPETLFHQDLYLSLTLQHITQDKANIIPYSTTSVFKAIYHALNMTYNNYSRVDLSWMHGKDSCDSAAMSIYLIICSQCRTQTSQPVHRGFDSKNQSHRHSGDLTRPQSDLPKGHRSTWKFKEIFATPTTPP